MTDTRRLFQGPAAWTRRQMESDQSWNETLDPAEADDVRRALGHAKATGKSVRELQAADFPLPVLGGRIARLAEELETGRGFALWRGLPVEEWTTDELQTVFWCLGMHLGRPIVQNAKGELLGSVMNTTGTDPQTNANSRFYHTNAAAPFHVDGADVVGLMCVRTAMQGGASLVVSSMSIHNEVARRRPDLLPLMFEPLWFDHRGERNAVTGDPWWVTSICGWSGDKLSMMYLRNFIESAQRYHGAPPLTPRHKELFDLIDSLAASNELCLSMEFRPGDIQWLNNHMTLHSRTSFTDWPEPERRRWLLRLWLNFERRDRFTDAYGFYGIATETVAA